MIKFIKQELPFEKSLKQRLDFICKFCKTKPTFINGNIIKIDKTIAEYQSVQELSVTLKEIERELIANRQRLNLYLKSNEELNIDIDNLKEKIKSQNSEIDDLKKENDLLKSSLKHFKTMIYNLIQFFIDRIHRDKDKEKYIEFAKELYEHNALDKIGFKLIYNPNKSDNLKNYNTAKKDDIEH